MAFQIDIINAAGDKIADGPLINAQSLSDTRKLDATGSAEFTMPASDPRTAYLSQAAWLDIYDSVDGYLGRYSFKSAKTDDKHGVGTLRVSATGALRELSQRSVHFARTYENETIVDIVDDLISLVPGWAANIDAGLGSDSITYEGESVQAAINMIRGRTDQHYRLSALSTPGANVLDFGAFGDDSGVRIINPVGADNAELDARTDIAIVDGISEIEERDAIVTRVIPKGAGQGTVKLDISTATLGSYATQTGVNKDGSLYYYIRDDPAEILYGVREATLNLAKIRPVSNSEASIKFAADALKLTAEVFLTKNKAPRVTYNVQLKALRSDVRPGQKVRLTYAGTTDGYAYIAVDEDFFVMAVTRNRAATGDRSATMEISSVAEKQKTDTDVFLGMATTMNALGVHVPISQSQDTNTYKRDIDPTHSATFTLRIRNETLSLQRALFILRSSPFTANVKAVSIAPQETETSTQAPQVTETSTQEAEATDTSTGGGDHNHKMFEYGVALFTPTARSYSGRDADGGAVTLVQLRTQTWVDPQPDIWTFESSGTHDHDVTIPAHDHDVTIPAHDHDVTIPAHGHDMEYGIFEDTETPDTIRLAINGIDRTGALGGPWAVGGGAATVELDITSILIADGLRQDHEITASCDAGQGEIEGEFDTLRAIQPIAV